MKKVLLNMIVFVCMFMLIGCSLINGSAGWADESDMTKYTNGFCFVNLLEEDSYYRNGKKIVAVLDDLKNNKDKFYKVRLNEKIFGSDYYSQTLEDWDYTWYFGDLKGGKPNGYGILFSEIDPDMEIEYIGEFDKGKIKGYGIFIDISGAIKYEGNIKKYVRGSEDSIKKANGKAVIPYTYSDILNTENMYEEELPQYDLSEDGIWVMRITPQYIGNIKKNELNGKGTEYFLNGNIKYEGKFKNSYYHGKGTLYYENGQVKYKGEFKNGSFHGKGTLYNEDGDVEYKGKFKNGDAA